MLKGHTLIGCPFFMFFFYVLFLSIEDLLKANTFPLKLNSSNQSLLPTTSVNYL